MAIIALITWVITLSGGLFMLAIWLIEYDREFQRTAATRLPIPVLSTHALLAVGGLVVWGLFAVTDIGAVARVAAVVLLGVALTGLFMAARWIGVYRSFAAGRTARAAGAGLLVAERPVPPERHFPVTVVVIHGVFAVVTLLLVLLTAVGFRQH
ncbi:MAG TPA: hypothetical protein VGI64_19435 [Streptosporangiaceae bacterium]|jgi:hypothetical protein